MRIDISKYKEHYHDSKGKMVDRWQEGIKLLPFTSNPSQDGVDKGAGLSGATGAFFRLLEKDQVQAIEDFAAAESKVRSYLVEKCRMKVSQADEFIRMFRDIMQVNGSLNVTDTAFLKYIPLVPDDDMISTKNKRKYRSGQTKLGNLLASMADLDFAIPNLESNNLFSKLLKDALVECTSGFGGTKIQEEVYYVLPDIRKSFKDDFKWIMEQDTTAIVRYIHLLLHFYVCYTVLQTLPKLSYRYKEQKPYYFILKSERISTTHDAVLSWKNILPKTFMDRIYGRSQALDIINCVLERKDEKFVGFYPEVLTRLSETPFEENKADCEELLRLYQKDKREVFSKRSSESSSIEEIDVTVNSYEEFFKKLERLCCGLQSPSYISRMRKKIVDLLSMRFLQLRRGNYVLTLDNEMLVFLVAMITKGQRVKLEEMYKGFNRYGIFFNRGTRLAIESYLLKLNLLDRKSDSGEAQYVKVIL
ncbi:DNA phosphorothioation-dependent restriction protein DptG [Paraprevotella clara]|uniref:Putative dnd system-associated protein 1 n=1 Tax=Paraprevotella clara YIT 11840 TaxID=762968 RepID=G5SSZ7_9BACT|nr:DNA phosphorothioation-dependent restriction protein DptG [Paraprevotella clara]EHG99784.1 putative dnd system-associated protein 1 [Paraprevotella clara YIT 11840]